MTMSPLSANYPCLKKKGVFITGGATSIGAALVDAFAKQGARVAFVDINEEAGEALCRRVADEGGVRPVFRKTDVTDLDELKKAVLAAAKANDGLAVVINNVGNDTRHFPEDVTPEFWHKTIAVNLDAAFFASQAALPALKENGGGSIINLGSIQTVLGSAQMPAYVTAKCGLNGMGKALATDYGLHNIRVNTITPGWVMTARQRELWATPKALDEWQKQCRLKGELTPGHIAAMALFLASDASTMITAQNFVVDAGRG